MCVIIVKPEGKAIPFDLFEPAWRANNHGAGFAVCKAGTRVTRIKKGFMRYKDFLRAVKRARIAKGDLAMFHFRIATHGKIDEATCHPFPVTACPEEIRKTETVVDRAVAHNGIISNPGGNYTGYSDSQTFIIDTLSKLSSLAKVGKKLRSMLIGSRLAIFDQGILRLFGDGWRYHDGYPCSNLHFLQRTVAPRAVCCGKQAGQIGFSFPPETSADEQAYLPTTWSNIYGKSCEEYFGADLDSEDDPYKW